MMLSKWNANAPYYLFFNVLSESPDTLDQTNAVKFSDLLCPSLGKLKSSLQLTFGVDICWLMEQYKVKNVSLTPLTILYHNIGTNKESSFMDENFKNVAYHQVKIQNGSHDSKIGIYLYDDDSLRVVVSTANLYKDWNKNNYGLWISPRCPLIEKNINNKGESRTGFKSDLVHYLKSYNEECLQTWIDNVERVDFSDIRVFLITSIPGIQPNGQANHLTVVANLLKKYCHIPVESGSREEKAWEIIGQAANIGALGGSFKFWLSSFLECLAAHKRGSDMIPLNASYSFIYPTYNNVMQGYSGYDDIVCRYRKDLHEQQKWFQKSMFQWKADRLNRSRAMPHIKSYTRISPCLTKLAYYLLTSANMTRSAWGYWQNDKISVRSFEAGVLFLPEFFDEEYFEISETGENTNETLFPFMYDLPLTRYNFRDTPWTNISPTFHRNA